MWQFVVWVGLMFLSYLLRPSATQQTNPDPGEISGTTVDSASCVPVLFGSRKMIQVNCVWYGDVGTTPIVNCSGGKK